MGLRPYHIWMEGFVVTGQSSGASCLTKEPIFATSFDEAVEKYQQMNSDTTIDRYEEKHFMTKEAYEKRRSNWKIWGCALFPTEAQAREAFG